MKRHVVAGILGLALAGCAQDRTALTRTGRGLGGPVGLPPELPPIHETVNRGNTPPSPIAVNSDRPQAGPAAHLADGRPTPTVGSAGSQAPAEVPATTPAPEPSGRVALAPATAPAPVMTEVPDAVPGMTRQPAAPAPVPSAAPDPLLGANPELTPRMEVPSRPAPTDRATVPAAAPAATAAPGPHPGVPAPAPARDPLLGADPDVMPPIEVPPAAPRARAPTPAPAPEGPPLVEIPSSPPGSGTPAPTEAVMGANPSAAVLEAPPAAAPPAIGGIISGSLPPVETPPPARLVPTVAPSRPARKSTATKPARDPLLGADPDVMPALEMPPASAPPAAPPVTAPAVLPEPVAVPALKDMAPLPGLDAPKAADPPKAGAALAPRSNRDPAVKQVAADPTMMRSQGPSRHLEIAGGIAARVGDDVITINELKTAMNERLKFKPEDQKLSPEETHMLAVSVLDDLIGRNLILQEARRKLKDPKKMKSINDVSDKVWREHELPPLMRKYAAANEFELKQKLDESGRTLEELHEAFCSRFLAESYMGQELGPRMRVELPEMRDYYNAHLKEFDRPAQVTWREIVIETRKSPSRAEASRKAGEVLARLLRGDDFAKVAQAESNGPNKAKGGLWETTPGSYAVAEVNDALERLPLMQISRVIESPDAYHIVRVESRRQAGPARFDEVQDRVRDSLFRARADRETNNYLEKLRQRSVITTPIFDGMENPASLARKK